uniref:Pleckstrin homology and RhoGEF domain containing G1 n=1 Tax=Salmo trutta TaxID=8032 RepID=A0A674A2R4_SALTR
MDSSPDSGERPISYGSTSSSASSRDSHCSLGSRSTLSPSSHCHPASDRDLDSGAIRLELVPARQLGCGDEEERKDGGIETGREMVKHGSAQTPQSDTEAGERSNPGPRVLYVDRVVQEILDTESTYVEDLHSIVQDYLECISNQSRLALSSEDRVSLFGNIRDIYHFNRDLLHDLEKCNSDPVAIAECFVSKSQEFHIYTQYCTNYPRSVAVLTECMRNKALAKFFRERQESLRHSLPLGSYLLKPVQRILKYHLLLHEIANHLEKDTETYEVVQEAIDTMQRVAWHINNMKRKHEHAVRLQEIQSLLTNWKGPDLIGYGELVLEGTFRLQRAKNERTLFLFDKLLLVTKKREEAYTYKAHILCCNLMLVEVILKEPLSFSVFHYKNPKLQHTVQAKSQQDKRMWILHLKRLILENHPAKIPAKVRHGAGNMYHPGFQYSLDRNKRSPHTKEGPSPRRVRRKSKERHHPPLLRTPCVTDEPPEPHVPSMLVPDGDPQTVGNIWADHLVRRAMFPTRQRTMNPDEEDEDIYQMFVPTEPGGPEPEPPPVRSEVTSSPSRTQGRPCSWHVEQVPIVQIDPPSTGDSRVLRRASSVGEKQTGSRQSPPDQDDNQQEMIHTESSSNDISGSSSAEHLTIDDIENVYDNISYEDLKSMGLIKREQEGRGVQREGPRDTQDPGALNTGMTGGITETLIEPDSLSDSNHSSTAQELKIVEEENIYDTICFREPPAKCDKDGDRKAQERDSLLQSASETDLMGCERLGGFVSEESLHFGEDEGMEDNSHPVHGNSEPDYSSSSASKTFSQHSNTGDRMSEQVDEIWNDLKNYIKENEKKVERLPAAFPMSTKRVLLKTRIITPLILPSLPRPSPCRPFQTLPLPGQSRASITNCPTSKEPSIRDLHSLFPGELGLDSRLASSSLLLGDSVDSFSQELMDKTKNRVSLMARQYSQKIKKANQMLRMKSMDPGDMSGGCNREEKKQQKDMENKQNDLAAILEEKKQGGAAIGARIAEYSQLYDQVMFKDPPDQGSSSLGPSGSHYSHPALPSSKSLPETCSSLGLEDDWLHSTYSNGELTSFVSEMLSSTPQIKLTPACSVPTLKTLPPSPETSPTQRWSSCVSSPSEKEEHVYRYIKQQTSFNSPSSSSSSSKPPPYSRCQSICSLVQRSAERLHGPSSLVRASRQSSLPEQSSFGHGHSDLTLQDSQQVVILNHASALSMLTATQNYMANFKDNGDDDDDDYVEIRSENKSERDQDCSRQCTTGGGAGGGGGSSKGPAQSQIQSLPCTPVRSSCGLMDRERLQEYLRAEQQTQQNQSNIVQSLREKFQCLSSSSFA